MTLIRRVASGAAQLTSANIFVRVLSLIVLPVLTHLLPPSAYGLASIITTLISLFSVLALAGADVSYIRAYHAQKSPSGQAVESLTWRFALGASVLAAVLSVACWRQISDIFLAPPYASLLVASGVILAVLNAMAVARARLHNRYHAIFFATIVSGLGASAIAIGIAYFGRRDELPLILSLLASYLVPVLILGLPPLSTLLQSSGLGLPDRRHVLGIGLSAIVTAPAYWIMVSSDRWFLAYFRDAATVGVYSISYSIAIVGMTVNGAFLTIWAPEAARLFETHPSDGPHVLGSITEGAIAVLACVWFAVTAAGGDMVRLLAAPAFLPGAVVIPFVAASVFFYGITHLANTVYLIEKRVHHTIFWWVGGAAVSIALNFLLVPRIGIIGAGLSQLFAFAITSSGLLIGARRMLSAHINWMRLLLVIVTLLPAAFLMLPSWAGSPFVSLLMKFPAGVGVVLIVAAYFGLPVAVYKNVVSALKYSGDA